MLKDKIVVIAGGLGLLGKNFVEGVINANGSVIIADINETAGNEFKDTLLTRYTNKVVDFHYIDITFKTSIQELIHSVQKKYGTSSLIITHDVDCARVISNRIILLIDGINYTEGSYKELNQSKDPKIQAFFK